MPEDRVEHRKFERHDIDFTVSVALPEARENVIETSVVKDISGSGIRFISSQPERYAIGQKIHLFIHLPGAGEASACMQGAATVVRIGKATKDQDVTISLRLDQPLSFDPTKHGSATA